MNLNTAVVLLGFVALECGVGFWGSWPLAAIIGGTLLMSAGLVPYWRKR